jgi:hypothetical protein
MGVVYRAFDTKLNRTVAIKVLAEDLADALARRRFQPEARMASSLNHPLILTVFDVGDWEGRQYLVTEYIDGGTLRQWVKEKRPWRKVVELLTGVADGDFGLAKVAEPPDTAVTRTIGLSGTRPGFVIGTIAYMWAWISKSGASSRIGVVVRPSGRRCVLRIPGERIRLVQTLSRQ